MKGAIANVVNTALFQPHKLPYYVDDVGAVHYRLYGSRVYHLLLKDFAAKVRHENREKVIS